MTYAVPSSLRPYLNGTTHISLTTITSASLENGRFRTSNGTAAQLTQAAGVPWTDACRLMRAMATKNARPAATRSDRKPLAALEATLPLLSRPHREQCPYCAPPSFWGGTAPTASVLPASNAGSVSMQWLGAHPAC